MSEFRELTKRNTDSFDRLAKTASDGASNTGFLWFDMMMNFQRQMQRASLQSFSSYSPTSDARITGRLPATPAATTIIAVGEERLNVATHTIQGETTRVRRRVVTQPVEQEVTLRDETVVVERRPATASGPKLDLLTETVVEMSDSRQVPTVWNSLHVAEEVVLRKNVTERVEKVRGMVRRDVVDVDHLDAMPEEKENVRETETRAHIPAPRPTSVEAERRGAPQLTATKATIDEDAAPKAAGPASPPVPAPAPRKG